MPIRFAAILAALAAVLALGAPRPAAHEGHDHETAPATRSENASPRLEASSARFELVAVANGASLTIWLDRYETAAPVLDATIEVETPSGPQMASPEQDGSFQLAAPWAAAPGRYDLIFTVTAGGEFDVLAATLVTAPTQQPDGPPAAHPGGTIVSQSSIVPAAGAISLGAFFVFAARRRPIIRAAAFGMLLLAAFGAFGLFAHEGRGRVASVNKAPPIGADRAQVLPDGAIFLPKATQRVLAVRTALGRADRHAKQVELPGRVIPDPNGSGLVQASATGRLSPPPGGFPRLGARVKAGDILAYVTTPFLAIDQSTMRQQQGELDQQILIVERRLSRAETLAKTGVVAQARLDETRIELDGLRGRRASLDKVKREPEPLRAPVDGIIASAHAVAGQIADPTEVVFQIVEPSRLWVEALAFEAPHEGAAASARAADGRTLTLSFAGAGFADRNQAAPVDFVIEGATEGLHLGQFVTVYAETSRSMEGFAAPRAAVVSRGNGEAVVYRHTGAERFEARPVRVEPLDGERVLIVAGVKPGERLVTQAAELLNQVR